jgi:hypothetical protein
MQDEDGIISIQNLNNHNRSWIKCAGDRKYQINKDKGSIKVGVIEMECEYIVYG